MILTDSMAILAALGHRPSPERIAEYGDALAQLPHSERWRLTGVHSHTTREKKTVDGGLAEVCRPDSRDDGPREHMEALDSSPTCNPFRGLNAGKAPAEGSAGAALKVDADSSGATDRADSCEGDDER